ncbi:hypothetical protein AAE478_007263 [Parahypoxylon ruwenzoriense]
MQFNVLLAAIFAAASANAAAVQPRQGRGFNVSKFSASCIPHSVMCSYDFMAAVSGKQSTKCSLMVHGPDYLPAVPLTGCEDRTVSWSVIKENKGLALTLTTPGAQSNITGTHAITEDQLVAEQHGAVITQRYTGPADFQITATA